MHAAIAMTMLLAVLPVSIPSALTPDSPSWSPLPGTRAVYQGLRAGADNRRLVWIGMREAAALRSTRADAWAFTIRRTEFDCHEKTLRLLDGVAFTRTSEPVSRLGQKPKLRIPPGTEAEAQLEAICAIF